LHRIIFSLQLVLKFLTNYFIVSNQIVKHLRGSPGDIGFLRKTKLTTGLESRWASLSRFAFKRARVIYTRKFRNRSSFSLTVDLLED